MSRSQTRSLAAVGACFALALATCLISPGFVAAADDADSVSYYKQVLPIFQARCHGCHQPAKSNGEYVMTDFAKMTAGGESELPAIVAHKPAESYLLDLITPSDGEAEMPKDKEPLGDEEVALIKRWIEQGAVNDTPSNLANRFTKENPPVYTAAPIITSLDFSPDGKYLAIAGFNEVLLHNAEGTKVVGRLIGESSRIQSVRFSPDGGRLAVAAGSPGRRGEIQIWDVEKQVLTLSQPVTYDTLYGANWSPDGKLVSFGCADNSIRAIDANTGEQVLFQGAHNDWPLDTVFSEKGTHLISVGRDRTAKLTEVETQRFIDNITSITPGALKGGIEAVDRHPTSDEILVGGADGKPKLYRVFRTSKRVIGDDANLIREFPALKGRIFSVAVSRDGKRIAAGSSLDGSGEVRIYAYDFDTNVPKELMAIMGKRVNQRSAEEKAKLAAYRKQGVTVLAGTEIPESSIYAVSFSADGKAIAAAGSDGFVRLIDSEDGTLIRQFSPVPEESMANGQLATSDTGRSAAERFWRKNAEVERESHRTEDNIVRLTVEPGEATISSPHDVVQMIATATLEDGTTLDVTRMATVSVSGAAVEVSSRGFVRPAADGQAVVSFALGGKQADAKITVGGMTETFHPDFVRDVTPLISKMGCNAGTCHGANKGKGGFKLSLRGNDPQFDVRALTDDLASRRVNLASPGNSLMVLKATAAVPHEGGQLTRPGEPYYEVVRAWIADGAKLDLASPRVASLEIFPKNPTVQRIGDRQQFRVVATYANGETRDVTADAYIESGDTEIGQHDHGGLVETIRRGEAPILARYEGKYAATTLTVMGDRSGFVWTQPPTNNFIDELVAAKYQRMKILPSELCTDAEFIRRIYLDLTGLPPTADQVRSFLADDRQQRIKRDELIDRLVGSEQYVEHWTNKWADLLQVNRKFLAVEGSVAFRQWIRDQLAANTPYDQFVREILTASGSNKENPAASYFKITRTPEDTMENTTQLFLGLRFNCNKCHDHPFEKWSQDQYYETAAYFAQFDLKKDPASGKREIGRTAVEAGKPLYEIVVDKNAGEVVHDRTGAVTPPQFPYPAECSPPQDASRRQALAVWLTSPDNQYFAKSYVNRWWGYLLGRGLIEPLDDIRAGNPPTNPELLERLTNEFIDSGFNVQHIVKLICKSRTYQLSIKTNSWNEDDKLNYSHAMARRLPAEVLYDAIHRVVGSTTKLPGVPAGTRAAELPDAGVKLPDGFLATLGRPPRESACECERSTGMQLGPVMALVSGPTLNNAVGDPDSELAKLTASAMDDAALVDELFLRILNRPATDQEIEAGTNLINSLPNDHAKLAAELAEYQAALQPEIDKQEAARQAAIDKAKQELAAYQQSIAAREAELDRKQQEQITKAESALREYESTLPQKMAEWEKQLQQPTIWSTLDPIELSSTNNAKLTKEDDLSVFVTGANGKTTYKVVGRTDVTNITAIRLELLADDRLPAKGPGRAQNGNFVLTEFSVEAAPEGAPDQKQKVVLQNAQADFSQDNYDVKTAIDGKQDPASNGWASSPQLGVNRTAVFETKEDLGTQGPTTLTFLLDQKYQDNMHSIGKFRISLANSPRPVRLDGLPKNIAEILAVAAEKRNDKQKDELLKYYRGVDAELKKLSDAVAAAKKPRPIDPQLKKLQEVLAEVSKPLPVDPKLARLRRDVELSQQQLNNRRLTAAQDIAWALINSPAFLFNR